MEWSPGYSLGNCERSQRPNGDSLIIVIVTVTDTTGTNPVESAFSQNGVKVYPNPDTRYLYFEFSEQHQKVY